MELELIVKLLRAPHGAGKPVQVDAAEMLEAQARKIARLELVIEELKAKAVEASWAMNPERMGR